MQEITVSELASVLGGSVAAPGGDTGITEVTTDSRSVPAGSLFIPIRGERFDGHEFIDAALEAGAAAVLTEREPERLVEGKAYIRVEDARLALGALAAHNRERLGLPVVAVTGSVGKTTAKDMLASVLGQKYRTLKTEGNLNNDIGLPLTLLRLDESYEAAVVEMGMNHLGEISYLTKLARPDIAVITNVGDAHIENLGSRDNILRAKSEIFEGLREGGCAVLNLDDTQLSRLGGRLGCEIIWYGRGGGSDVCCIREVRGETELHVTLRAVDGMDFDVVIPAPGAHMAYPALIATAVGRRMGLDTQEIRRGIESFEPSERRMYIRRIPGGVTLLDDCYNANPQSVAAALDTLAGIQAKTRVAILGDMLELGKLSDDAHRQVGELAAQLGIDAVISIGELAWQINLGAAGCPQHHYYNNKRDAYREIFNYLRPGAAVLVKASHGMHFEEISASIVKYCDANGG